MVVEQITSPELVQAVAQDFIQFLGALLYALVIVMVGWLVGTLVSEIIKKLLEAVKFENFLKSHKVEDTLGSTKISSVVTKLVKYYIILLFLADALKLVQLGTIGALMNDVVNFVPVMFGALLVVIVAAMLGELAKEKILEVSRKSSLTKASAKLAKAIFIYVGFVVGLGTMGFSVLILEQAFATLLQGLIYGIALAVGISFGLGGQDEAKDIVKKTRKKLNL